MQTPRSRATRNLQDVMAMHRIRGASATFAGVVLATLFTAAPVSAGAGGASGVSRSVDEPDASYRRRAAARPAGVQLGKGRFLVASRKLVDPNFKKTIVLLIEHGPTGALGLVINQRSELRVSTLLPGVEELRGSKLRVFLGGPVALQGVMLLLRTDDPPQESIQVLADVHLSGSLEVLREYGKRGEDRMRAYVGHAGWAPGQLESEVARGDWHVVPGSAAEVFADDTEAVWPRIIESFEGQWARGVRVRFSGRCRASPRW
jgi:putative transcriptional regulator